MQNCQFTPRILHSFSEKLTHSTQSDRVGDHICIFGFSRGAYTALALAGMLQKVGLLPQCNIEQLPFAYAMYEREDKEGLKLSVQFKRTFSVDVKIQLLGVWYVTWLINQLSASCFLQGHRAVRWVDPKTFAILRI